MKNIVIAAIFIFFSGLNLFAGVNLKNGNFYITYSDHNFSSGYLIFKEVSRTYNSKSIYKGLFGYGWGSEFETRLNAYPDGTVRITEFGGGGKTFFIPSLPSGELIDLMVDSLIDAMIKSEDLDNEIQKISKERSKLKNNIELRTSKWDKYVAEDILTYVSEFPEGVEWESYLRGNETLIFSNGQFIRHKDRTWTFNANGQLIKVKDKDGYYSELEYKNEFLSKIKNSDGSINLFEVNQNGQVEKIISRGENDGSSWEGISTYKYDGINLTGSIDAANNIYKYTYDESHNMTSITYEDDSKYLIEYYPSTMYVKSLTDRNGEKTEYKYNVFYNEDGSINNDHYGTYVTKPGFDGNPVTNYYEYKIETKSSGDRYNSEILTEIYGVKTRTKYDGLCERPIEISRGSQTTKFEYNNRCLLVSKTSNSGENTTLEYHPELEKITKVNSNGLITNFEYDEKGNLIYAERPKDSSNVYLEYNKNGSIKRMKQGDNLLNFEYNAMKKPVKITLEGEGYINVEYDENGEIMRVVSPDGHSMAMKVTQLFQGLLSLTKPANVNFDM
jgi:YD repeat-containing protein